ncbi:MAG TPA: hypothetical protein V6C86_15195 [Oculatellaceae cyanobacterium]
MRINTSFKLLAMAALTLVELLALPSTAEEILGTGMGIPAASPPVLWPRGMSLEALNPDNLYPNGTQFGLSNTSGGFGTSGSGPMSGVGLSQRSVSPLVQRELQMPLTGRMSSFDVIESTKVDRLFGIILSGPRPAASANRSYLESALLQGESYRQLQVNSTDSILGDKASTVDTILKTGF